MKIYSAVCFLIAISCLALLFSVSAQDELEHEEPDLLEGVVDSVNELTKSIDIDDLKRGLGLPESDFSDILSIVDGDNDGVIEKHEMMLLFTMLDDNSDKSLTKRETASWLSTMSTAGTEISSAQLDTIFGLFNALDIFESSTVLEAPEDEEGEAVEGEEGAVAGVGAGTATVVPCLVQNNAALPFFKPECAKEGTCKSGSVYDFTRYGTFEESDFPEDAVVDSDKRIDAPKALEPEEESEGKEHALAEDRDKGAASEGEGEDEEMGEVHEIGGKRELLFGLFDRNMDQTIEPFEIVMFADEMDLDKDGYLSHEEVVMWLAGSDYDAADILKLLSWDLKDFPSDAEIRTLSEGGIDLLYGGVNEETGEDLDLEEISVAGADAEEPDFDHEKFQDESPVGSKGEEGDDQGKEHTDFPDNEDSNEDEGEEGWDDEEDEEEGEGEDQNDEL